MYPDNQNLFSIIQLQDKYCILFDPLTIYPESIKRGKTTVKIKIMQLHLLYKYY